MRAPRFGSFLFVVLLLCTIGLKVFVLIRQPDTGMRTRLNLRALLTAQGFELEPDDAEAEPPFVAGHAGDCALVVFIASPHGWHRYLLREMVGPGDTATFLYDKARYADQPVWSTWRVNELMGHRMADKPVLGVRASSACGETIVPWAALIGLSSTRTPAARAAAR